MKWILAAAAVVVLGLFAAEAPAQPTTPSTGTPSVTQVQTVPIQTGRTGLFRRAQERRGRVMTMEPPTTVTPTTPATTKVESIPVTPAPTTQPTVQYVESRTGLFGRVRARR